MTNRIMFVGILALCLSGAWGANSVLCAAPTTEEIIKIVSSGSPEEVAGLLNSGIDVNLPVTEKEQPLILLAAATNANEDVINLLLAAGANVDLKNSEGVNALQLACESNANPKVIEALLSSKIDIHERDNDGCTALMYAASSTAKPEIIDLLIKAGAKVDNTDNEGKTALMYAAGWNSEPAVLQALIKAKPQINSMDHKGKTALLHAKEHNAIPEIFTVLSKAGAQQIKLGFLKIDCNVDSVDVYSGDSLLGTLPQENLQLPEGKYSLRFVKTGYLEKTEMVTISEKKKVDLNIKLVSIEDADYQDAITSNDKSKLSSFLENHALSSHTDEIKQLLDDFDRKQEKISELLTQMREKIDEQEWEDVCSLYKDNVELLSKDSWAKAVYNKANDQIFEKNRNDLLSNMNNALNDNDPDKASELLSTSQDYLNAKEKATFKNKITAAQQYIKKYANSLRATAVKCAKALIFDDLYSPSSATFHNAEIKMQKGFKFIVWVRYESQNLFGVYLRKSALVYVKPKVGSDTYGYNSLFPYTECQTPPTQYEINFYAELLHMK